MCGKLTSITIPDGVTSIGKNAFQWCSVTSFSIPNSVTNIGARAFDNCQSLSSITIGSGVTVINDGTFGGCKRLTSVVVPDGVTSLGYMSFAQCDNLETLTIPDTVTTIGDEVFWGCNSFKETRINITNMALWPTTSINRKLRGTTIRLFTHGEEITTYVVPDSVMNIADDAFSHCNGLVSISLPGRFRGNTGNMGIPSGCTVTFRD